LSQGPLTHQMLGLSTRCLLSFRPLHEPSEAHLKPLMQRFDNRPTSSLSHLSPVLGRMAADLCVVAGQAFEAANRCPTTSRPASQYEICHCLLHEMRIGRPNHTDFSGCFDNSGHSDEYGRLG
jgi:hypothetical protein